MHKQSSICCTKFFSQSPTHFGSTGEERGYKILFLYVHALCLHSQFFPSLSLLREKIFERKKVSTKNMLNCCKREREGEFGNPFRFVSHIISYFLSYPIRKLSWKKRNVAAAFVYLKKQKKMLKNKFVFTKAWLAKFRKQN